MGLGAGHGSAEGPARPLVRRAPLVRQPRRGRPGRLVLYDPRLIRRQLTLHYPRDECRGCPYAAVMSLGWGVSARWARSSEWLEDVSEGGIGSRVVLVAVPAGWGRSSVLGAVRPGHGRG